MILCDIMEAAEWGSGDGAPGCLWGGQLPAPYKSVHRISDEFPPKYKNILVQVIFSEKDYVH